MPESVRLEADMCWQWVRRGQKYHVVVSISDMVHGCIGAVHNTTS